MERLKRVDILENQSEFQDRGDLVEDLLQLGFNISGDVNSKNFAFLLRCVDARAGSAWPTFEQIGMGIVVTGFKHIVAVRRHGLYDAGGCIQYVGGVGYARQQAFSIRIQALLGTRRDLSDSDGKN
jgi:hypothetical protein